MILEDEIYKYEQLIHSMQKSKTFKKIHFYSNMQIKNHQ